MTVSEDEMIGEARLIATAAAGTGSRRPFTLQRVNSPGLSNPRQQ